METTAAAVDDPLLSYSITTTPSPLKASPENEDYPEETGEVIIAVARQSGTPANVEWIKVKVPAGDRAPDLATDLNKITYRISLDGWTSRLDAAAKEFVFTPRSTAPIGPDDGFTIQLSGIPMNRTVGTAPITITERSHTGNAAPQNRPTVFNLGKFPADFYLRNFLCEPSVIQNGGDVRLTWERSANATYELLYGDVNICVTDRSTHNVEGIKSDTTFYLRATAGDATNPVVRIVSAQVTVNKPDLEIGNLTVHGEVLGPLRVGSVYAKSVSGSLRPDADSSLFSRASVITTNVPYERVAPSAGLLVGHNIGGDGSDGMLNIEVGKSDKMRRTELGPDQSATIYVSSGDTIKFTFTGRVTHETIWYAAGGGGL
ncbi:hypothetical protein [Streptomyces lavendulae]|uniref:hypothetical protein n=1 Tax=Streptomyces lavendulae TaxID=1914 RepID=UPI001901B229|nr:hypothetical protein [Streptomyces lavendulae]